MALLNRTTFTVAYEVHQCHMTEMQSLIDCTKNPHVDDAERYRMILFLYQMQLQFAKELVMIPKYSYSPKDFVKPTSESILGSQYVGEADFAAGQTVLTNCNNSSLFCWITFIKIATGHFWEVFLKECYLK